MKKNSDINLILMAIVIVAAIAQFFSMTLPLGLLWIYVIINGVSQLK